MITLFGHDKNDKTEPSSSTTMTETGEQSVGFKSLRTPDIQQLLNVPWDVPKLKKKLQNRNFCFRGQPSSPELSPRRYRMQPNH